MNQQLLFGKQKKQESDSDDQMIKYRIISQNNTNQILQFILGPHQTVYIQGQILYSNQQLFDQKTGFFTKIKKNINFNILSNRKLKQLTNPNINFSYYGLRGLGGKILILDSQVYNEIFYLNCQNLIFSNLGEGNGTFTKHPKLSKFQKATFDKKNFKQNLPLNIIQSKSGNLIIEKNLGSDENFICSEKIILGFSERGYITMRGPGWVFLGTTQNKLFKPKQMGCFQIFCIGLLVWYILSLILEAALVVLRF